VLGGALDDRREGHVDAGTRWERDPADLRRDQVVGYAVKARLPGRGAATPPPSVLHERLVRAGRFGRHRARPVSTSSPRTGTGGVEQVVVTTGVTGGSAPARQRQQAALGGLQQRGQAHGATLLLEDPPKASVRAAADFVAVRRIDRPPRLMYWHPPWSS
jgi:hypothetical protein